MLQLYRTNLPINKDKFLGFREATGYGFYRNLVGQQEKFLIQKAANIVALSFTSSDTSITCSNIHFNDLVTLKVLNSTGLISTSSNYKGLFRIVYFNVSPFPAFASRRNLNTFFHSNNASDDNDSDASSTPIPGGTAQNLTQNVQNLVVTKEMINLLIGFKSDFYRSLVSSSGGNVNSNSNVFYHGVKLDKIFLEECQVVMNFAKKLGKIRCFLATAHSYRFGLLPQAVVAAFKQVIKPFDTFLIQIEKSFNQRKLNISKLIFLLQPFRNIINVLYNLSLEIDGNDAEKVSVLDILYKSSLEAGDSETKLLFQFITNKVLVIYNKMLSKWIQKGVVDDPYFEFLVYDNSKISYGSASSSRCSNITSIEFNANYWERKFTLRDELIPNIFKKHAHVILTTGKYINVVREITTFNVSNDMIGYYSDVMKSIQKVSISSSSGGAAAAAKLSVNNISDLLKDVEDRYKNSSRILLQLLEGVHKLSSHFRSLRRFFLLENGDFLTQFTDIAAADLAKDVSQVKLSRLEHALHLAISTSTLASDPHRDRIECSLMSTSLIQQIESIRSAGEYLTGAHAGSYSYNNSADSTSGGDAFYAPLANEGARVGLKTIEAVTLHYKVHWPVSILLSNRSVMKYQLLSRLLFLSKYVESCILSSWKSENSELKVRTALSESLSSYNCLRHRMLHFLQNFVYYISSEVIGPRAFEMQNLLAKAVDMDEIMELHEGFLDSCMEGCLLASSELLKVLTKLLTICLLFSNVMRDILIDYNAILNSYSASKGAAEIEALKRKHNTAETFTKFNSSFDVNLKLFLDKLKYESSVSSNKAQLSNLFLRLDYNSYYAGVF